MMRFRKISCAEKIAFRIKWNANKAAGGSRCYLCDSDDSAVSDIQQCLSIKVSEPASGNVVVSAGVLCRDEVQKNIMRGKKFAFHIK